MDSSDVIYNDHVLNKTGADMARNRNRKPMNIRNSQNPPISLAQGTAEGVTDTVQAPSENLAKVALYPPVTKRVTKYAETWGLSRQAAVNQLLIECFTHLHQTDL